MKKNNIYRIINLILAFSYVAINYMFLKTSVFNIYIENFWFITFCLFVGMSMVVKSILFKSDSSLWLGIVLLLVEATMVYIDFKRLGFSDFWYLSFAIPAVSCLVVGVIYKNLYLIKVFTTLFFGLIPVLLYKYVVLNTTLSIVVVVLCLWGIVLSWKIISQINDNKK